MYVKGQIFRDVAIINNFTILSSSKIKKLTGFNTFILIM